MSYLDIGKICDLPLGMFRAKGEDEVAKTGDIARMRKDES
jgi:hypothetical protein